MGANVMIHYLIMINLSEILMKIEYFSISYQFGRKRRKFSVKLNRLSLLMDNKYKQSIVIAMLLSVIDEIFFFNILIF